MKLRKTSWLLPIALILAFAAIFVDISEGAIYPVHYTFVRPKGEPVEDESETTGDDVHIDKDDPHLQGGNGPNFKGAFEEGRQVLWHITEGGMFGGRDPNFISGPAGPTTRGLSDIKLDLTFQREDVASAGSLDLIFARPEQERQIGGVKSDTGEKVYCCTESLTDSVAGCTKPGHLILRPMTRAKGTFTDPVFRASIVFSPNQTENEFTFTYYVRRTGILKVVLADCDPKSGDVKFDGTISFKNPYGYLPGQLFGFLSVYGWLGWVYFGTVMFWTFWCIRRIDHLLPLHFYASGLLILGWIESSMYHHAYNHINETGAPPCCPLPAALVFADVVSVMKIVPSKILILLVSMGWGITKPSLGDATKYIKTFGFVYFWWGLSYQLLTSVSHKEQVSFLVQAFIIVPVALMDSLLILWVFAELQRTRTLLVQRRQVHKVVLYRKFTAALIFFIIAAVAWSAWGVVVAAQSRKQDQWMYMHWRSYFLYGGIPPGGVMWDLLYFGMLVVVLLLFYPGAATAAYAYQRGEELDDGIVPLASMENADDWEERSDGDGRQSRKPRSTAD